MIDIVYFEGDKFNLGFSKVYHYKEFNIKEGSRDNRKILEEKKLDILISAEKHMKNDFIYFKNSGLNHVSCKLANKNRIAIGFSFNDFLKSKNRDVLLGRMMQNVVLCRKYKVSMVVCSFAKNKFEMRDARDLISFARMIGMSPGEAKKALNFKKKEEDIKIY